ncbi:MAG: copper chaperone PCu(A)C [Pseudomonadota bacterium]
MTSCFNRAARYAGMLTLAFSMNASAAVTAAQAWVREVPPQSTVAAVFVELNNTGRRAEHIVAMSSPLAARVEWHDMRHENGRMEMSQRLKPELPAGSRTTLAPMASHFMLLGLQQPLRVGMSVPLTLTLASGKTISLLAEVRPSL